MSDEDIEESIRRSARRRRHVVTGLGIAAAAGFAVLAFGLYRQHHPAERPSVELTGAQRARLVAALERSRAVLTAADRPWKAKLAAVDPAAMPADAPPCMRLDFHRDRLAQSPQSWGGWSLGALPIERHGTMSLSSTPYPFELLAAGAPLPEHSAELRARLHELDEERRALDRPSFSPFEDRLSRVSYDSLYATEVVLRLEAVVAPHADPGGGAGTFAGGAVIARGWMYDHRANQVVCAGTVQVESSSLVDTGWTGLNEDLLINLVREAPGALRAR